MAAAPWSLVSKTIAVLAVFLAVAEAGNVLRAVEDYTLPEGLLVGAGTSAVQTEGAWNVSGKAPSVTDSLLHSPLLQAAMKFNGSHDIAANSYDRFREDIAMAKAMNLSVYRFSISWARVLPEGNPWKPNKEGRDFYHKMIDAILEANITPMVTLYHFDHPQSLQTEFGGWESEKMSDKFAEYADWAFNEYGDKVKLWTTLNEPNQYCMYFNLLFTVGGIVKPGDVDIHRCMHNTVLGHMKAYRRYKQNYYMRQGGKVGFTALLVHAVPKTTSAQDVYAADAFNQIHCGQILHPVVFGDYPSLVKKLMPKDRLIAFTKDQVSQLEDSTDFLGLNIYNGLTVKYNKNASATGPHVPIFNQLLEHLTFVEIDGGWEDLMAFDRISPEVLGRSMVWTWQQYGKPIVITENGYSGHDDQKRAYYFSVYLREFVKTARDFGIKVMAYCAWSLIDAFEWSGGYSRPFGLVHVDYEHGSLNRTLKEHSSKFFIELAKTNKVPYVASSASTAPTTILGLLIALLVAMTH